jgi:CheY-like chemotaxis protein
MAEKARVLVVEDDPDQAYLFSTVVETLGVTAVCADTAEAALMQLHAGPIALALVDWDLPGIQGDTLITVIKQRFPGVKTVLYSNHTHVVAAGEAVGADAAIQKIEGIHRIRETITSLLALPKAE